MNQIIDSIICEKCLQEVSLLDMPDNSPSWFCRCGFDVMANELAKSQAYVNGLLAKAGRPDLFVDYSKPLGDPTRLEKYYDEVMHESR